MGFVAVSVNELCEQIKSFATVDKHGYVVKSDVRDDVQFGYRIRDECLSVSSSNSGDKIKFTFGFIYTLEELKYLDVSPDDVVWISPNEAIVYFVSSNTDWIVE